MPLQLIVLIFERVIHLRRDSGHGVGVKAVLAHCATHHCFIRTTRRPNGLVSVDTRMRPTSCNTPALEEWLRIKYLVRVTFPWYSCSVPMFACGTKCLARQAVDIENSVAFMSQTVQLKISSWIMSVYKRNESGWQGCSRRQSLVITTPLGYACAICQSRSKFWTMQRRSKQLYRRMCITLDLCCTCENFRPVDAKISAGTGMTSLYHSALIHVCGVV